jgi:ABC-2 type transport system permease protein
VLVPAAIRRLRDGSPATGMAEDLSRGLVDRFRSLPMSQAAVLAGPALTDTATSALAVVLITGVGVALGFRPEAGAPRAAVRVRARVGFAFCWVAAWIETLIGNAKAAPVAT